MIQHIRKMTFLQKKMRKLILLQRQMRKLTLPRRTTAIHKHTTLPQQQLYLKLSDKVIIGSGNTLEVTEKKDGIKWILEEVEAMQYTDDIKSLLTNFARKTIGLSGDITTKRRVVETFDAALAKDKDCPFIPTSAPTTELVSIEAVMGKKEFLQLRTEVNKRRDEFNKFYSNACHTTATWVTQALTAKRREVVLEEGLRLACLMTSQARYKLGRTVKYSYALRQQAAVAFMECLTGPSAEFLGYLGASEHEISNELKEVVKKANLGFVNLPSIDAIHHRTDYTVMRRVVEKLDEVIELVTTGVEDYLDNLHFKRMHEVEAKTLLRTMEVTAATDATTEVLKKAKKTKEGRSLEEAMDEAAARKVDKHFKKQQQQLRKNSSAGGQRPSSVAEPNGTSGRNDKQSRKVQPRTKPILRKEKSTKKNPRKVSFSTSEDGKAGAPSKKPAGSQPAQRRKKTGKDKNATVQQGVREGSNNGGRKGKNKQRK